jgi:CheY-like chemotaxis protein
MTDSLNILLIEDSNLDALLMSETFGEAQLRSRLYRVGSLPEAFQYLHRQGPFWNSDRPDLILLDLRLQNHDGFEVLKELKKNPQLCSIPVVVLSTSASEGDVRRSYELGAASYVTKPLDVYDFLRVLQGIEEYWLHVVALPQKRPFAA